MRFEQAKLQSKYAHSKVASVYDRLGSFNRSLPTELSLDGFSDNDHVALKQYIHKNASSIDASESGEALDKRAFMTGGADYFTKAKQMIMTRLGYTEERAAQMASSVVKTANKIMETYGGDEHQVLDRLVEEIQNQSIQSGGNAQEVANAHETLVVPRTSRQIHDFTKQQLIRTLGVNHYEAERLAKSTVQESRDLLIQLRPHTLPEIVNTLIMMMQHYNDPTIIYGLRSDPYLVEELKNALQHVGGR